MVDSHNNLNERLTVTLAMDKLKEKSFQTILVQSSCDRVKLEQIVYCCLNVARLPAPRSAVITLRVGRNSAELRTGGVTKIVQHSVTWYIDEKKKE